MYYSTKILKILRSMLNRSVQVDLTNGSNLNSHTLRSNKSSLVGNFQSLWWILLGLFLNGCNNYYKNFIAPNNQDYTQAKEVTVITTKSKKFPLNYTNRYAIPNTTNSTGEVPLTDLTPPNYVEPSDLK